MRYFSIRISSNRAIKYLHPHLDNQIFNHGTPVSIVPISQSELLVVALNMDRVVYAFIKIPNLGHCFTLENYSELFQQAPDPMETTLK